MSSLRRQYFKMKGTSKEFEVVCISLISKECYYWNYLHRVDMPWLVHPYANGFGRRLVGSFFKEFTADNHSTVVGLVAFGNKGYVKTKHLYIDNNMDEKFNMKEKAFPFIDKNLED